MAAPRNEGLELSDMSLPKAIRKPTVVEQHGSIAGNSSDTEQLARLGKHSVLRRNFGFVTIMGFCCALLATWEVALGVISTGLFNGGPAGIIYGYIFVWIGNISVFASLCELLSLAPTSGGQYHWVAMLAPAWCSRFLSYLTGWLTLAGWQGTCAAAGFLWATILQGLATFMYPSYVPTPWQAILIGFALLLVVVFINTVVSSVLPQLEGTLLIFHIIGFFAIVIVLVTFTPSSDASFLFIEFYNGGAWSSQGLSFMVGLTGVVYCFAGVDCSFHMVEEVRNPSKTVPLSIMVSILVNGAMGLGMFIALLFASTDLTAALESSTGFPYIEIYYQATNSRAGTAAMVGMGLVLSVGSTVGVVASTSRIFWAFARDRGLPFSQTLSKVNPWTKVPVWAVTIPSAIAVLLSFINLGSQVVYNAFISISVSGLYSSYLVAASVLLYRRVGKGFKDPDPSAKPCLTEGPDGELTLAWGPWHLPGMFGIINNTFAIIFMVIVWFFAFWPPMAETTGETMNWAIVMTGSLMLFSTIYYFLYANKQYHGPVFETYRSPL